MMLSPGKRIGPYNIVDRIGAGGMGEVYKARDSRLNRDVAIKVFLPERVADPRARERFIQEARTASALNHPNIVTIHDVLSDEGTECIVMEYIEGTTLTARIPPKGMRAGHALHYAVQMADALAKAHAAGIVHRDLKPSNVMVTPEGRVKILDFGVAKLLEPAVSQSEASTVAPLTQPMMLAGTAAYMSPEQAEGRMLDGRSDIFSFGIVLYEMVTGRRPFTGPSFVALLSKILNEDPKVPGEIGVTIPPALEQAILRCLRKDPDRRFQTMADLKVALEDIEAETISTPGSSAPRTWRRWAWAAALPIGIAIAYLGWQVRRPAESLEPLRADALTTFPGQELYPALSSDGSYVAFTWTGPRQDNTDVYVQQIGAGTPLRLTTDVRDDYNPVWSPDGRWIAFLRGDPANPLDRSDREVRLIPPLGGPERKLTDVHVQEIAVNPAYLTWCPDSSCVIVTDSLGQGKPDALTVVSLETGAKRPLTQPQAPVLGDTNPTISPDGTTLSFLRRMTWSIGELHILPLGNDVTAAGEARRIPAGRLPLDSATWMPDGKAMVVAPPGFAGNGSLWKVAITGDGRPVRLPFVGENGVMPAVSRSQPEKLARLVYVRSLIDENIWRVDMSEAGVPASSPPAVAIASTQADIHPQVSPDGSRVAFTSTRSGPWELWVSDLDGSNAVQLTSLAAPTGTGVPRWSPDGQSIVFASDVEGQFDIFVVASAGGKPSRLTSDPSIEHVPSFSRDGRWIYFSSMRTGQYQVWKVSVSGGDPVQVTKDGGWVSFESADGRDLYFTTAPVARTALWRIPPSGGQAVKVLDEVMNQSFAPVSRGIYYIDQPAAEARLRFHDIDRRRSVTVATALGDRAPAGGFAAAPDGRAVFYARVDSSVDDLMLVDNFR